MSSLAFSLKPLLAEDIPVACKICSLAMENDRHTMLKAAHPTKPYVHESGMYGAFEYWLSLPQEDTDLVKAVEDDTGDVLGLICWHKRLEKDNFNERHVNETSNDEAPKENLEKPSVVVSQNYRKCSTTNLDPLAELNELTSSHLAGYQNKIMPQGTRCMYIGTLAVHPAHQKRGIGSALIKYGTDRADSERVICWVHSSDGAQEMYRKSGFETDDALVIHLGEWAKQMDIKPPQGGEDAWGDYTFTYMVRQPKSS